MAKRPLKEVLQPLIDAEKIEIIEEAPLLVIRTSLGVRILLSSPFFEFENLISLPPFEELIALDKEAARIVREVLDSEDNSPDSEDDDSDSEDDASDSNGGGSSDKKHIEYYNITQRLDKHGRIIDKLAEKFENSLQTIENNSEKQLRRSASDFAVLFVGIMAVVAAIAVPLFLWGLDANLGYRTEVIRSEFKIDKMLRESMDKAAKEAVANEMRMLKKTSDKKTNIRKLTVLKKSIENKKPLKSNNTK